jgi:hypothetical protein
LAEEATALSSHAPLSVPLGVSVVLGVSVALGAGAFPLPSWVFVLLLPGVLAFAGS